MNIDIDKFIEVIKKSFTDLEKAENKQVIETPIVKSVESEERRALFVVLEPDSVDLHGDTYSAKDVEKACNNFNVHCRKANLFHQVETDMVEIEQSFISLNDFSLDSGQEIKKGTWLMWMHFPETSEEIWKMVKEGDITGVSVGCRADVEILEE